MKNIIKRVVALSLCFLLVFGLTACHKAGEKALIIGEEEYTSAFYSCALIYADLEGQQLVYDTLGEEAAMDYLNQTLDGVNYTTWVKNRAIAVCKEMTAYKQICNNIMIYDEAFMELFNEYADELIDTADINWENAYSAIMEENGVGRGTFRWYNSMAAYKEAYFDYLYSEGGEKEIPAADIEAQLIENYTISNVILTDVTEMTENEVKELETKLEAYATRIKQGEKFAKIYAEHTETAYTENTEVTDTFSYELASLFGSENTKVQYQSEYFEDVKAMANGEIEVIKKVDDTDSENPKTTVLFVYKADIMGENNIHLDDLKGIVRHSLKDEEFEKGMQETINALTVEENERATKRFKVEKIKYPVA